MLALSGKNFLRRILGFVLMFGLVISLLPTQTAAAVRDNSATIEAQIRAYADSIDRTNAVDDAAAALATHGLVKRGKTLTVGATTP